MNMNDMIFSLTLIFFLKYFSPARIGPFFAIFGGDKEPLAMPAVTFILEKEKM